MKILALETAGDACSAALVAGDDALERHRVAPRQHAELILEMVRALLDESDLELGALDAVAFGRGPGSFTGVRIAAGVAQGLAYGADLPVIAISSLAALAQGALREQGSARVLAALDARMGEVYWGAYLEGADGLVAACIEDCVSAPQSVPLPDGDDWQGVGGGWAAHSAALIARIGDKLAGSEPQRLARALDVALLAGNAHARGESVPASQALPVYVRNRVARKREM